MSTPPTPPETGSTTAPTYGRTALHGAAWITIAVSLGKVSGLLANIVLGWLLTQRDFGLLGLALALTTFVTSLRDGGAVRMLRRPDEFARLGRAAGHISLLFNFAAAAIVVLIAPIGATVFGEPLLFWMMLIIAISVPLSNRPILMRARLVTELRFREMSRATTIRLLARNILMVLFAALGCGPFSLVLPLPLLPIIDWIVLSRMVPTALPGERLNRELAREILKPAVWIMAGLIAGAITATGINTPIGWFQSTDVVGVFFFGMQLAVAPAVLFASGLRQILMPTLTRLRDDAPRQATAYLNALRGFCIAGAPICAGAAVCCAPLVQFLYQGKWNAAIPVVQLLTLTVALRAAGMIGGSLIESHDRWRLRAIALWVDAITALITAGVGAWMGGIESIVIWVGLHRVVAGLGHCILGAAVIGMPVHRVITAMMPVHVLSIGAAAAVYWGLTPWIAPLNPVLQAIVLLGAYVVLCGSLLLLFMRQPVLHLYSLARRRRTGSGSGSGSGATDR